MAVNIRVLAIVVLFTLITSPQLVSVQGHTASSFTVLIQENGFSQDSPDIIQNDSIGFMSSVGSGITNTASSDSFSLGVGFLESSQNAFSEPPTITDIIFPSNFGKSSTSQVISAMLYDLNGIKSVEMELQIGGGDEVVMVSMLSSNNELFEATIPDSIFKVKNFRARIIGLDNMGEATFSEYYSSETYIRGNKLSMSNDYSHYPNGIIKDQWKLVSWPAKLFNNNLSYSELNDGHVFYRYRPVKQDFVIADSLELGKAYWFRHKYNKPVIFDEDSSIAIPLFDYSISLSKGWNLIGSPFSFPVTFEKDSIVGDIYTYGNFENEGSSLWNLNSESEILQDSVFRRGSIGLLHKRNSDSPSNIVTNLEDRFPFQNNLFHSLHGYIKTVNSKNVTLEARYFDSRSGESLFTASIQDSLNGNNNWEKYWDEIPKIENNNQKVISEETAYQMTSILQGAVKRGTAKKLRALKVPLAGKTGTTNDNYDAWFIGFSSNLVVGVYIGYDTPKSLGKFETGSKAALPIFKDFVKNSLSTVKNKKSSSLEIKAMTYKDIRNNPTATTYIYPDLSYEKNINMRAGIVKNLI